MKSPTFAFQIAFGPPPFLSVVARPCMVLEICGEQARIQQIGVKGQRVECWVPVDQLASKAEKALDKIGDALTAQRAKYLTATNEKSAADQVAGGVAV